MKAGLKEPQGPYIESQRQLSTTARNRLRREFEQLRAEAGDRARAGARGAGLLAAAGVTGALAAGAALTLPVLVMRRFIGAGGTALVIAAGAGGITAYLAKRGLDELGVPTDAAAERVKEAAQHAVGSV